MGNKYLYSAFFFVLSHTLTYLDEDTSLTKSLLFHSCSPGSVITYMNLEFKKNSILPIDNDVIRIITNSTTTFNITSAEGKASQLKIKPVAARGF